jgi:hypothetical protein
MRKKEFIRREQEQNNQYINKNREKEFQKPITRNRINEMKHTQTHSHYHKVQSVILVKHLQFAVEQAEHQNAIVQKIRNSILHQ